MPLPQASEIIRKSCWAATVMALACGMSAHSAENDAFLVPVYYDVYLQDENPLSRFAVNHPCGAIVTLQANKLPVNVPGVELSWAYELDEKGATKTKWPMPLDATPLAIDGNRLTIHQFNAERVVIVTVDGEIGIDIKGPPKAPTPEKVRKHNFVECPAGVHESNACLSLLDATTGSPRTISYPLVCT